jgi:hypothetical protein
MRTGRTRAERSISLVGSFVSQCGCCCHCCSPDSIGSWLLCDFACSILSVHNTTNGGRIGASIADHVDITDGRIFYRDVWIPTLIEAVIEWKGKDDTMKGETGRESEWQRSICQCMCSDIGWGLPEYIFHYAPRRNKERFLVIGQAVVQGIESKRLRM